MKRIYTTGFTVLEFLVVVAMIGILIALVLVGLTSARARAHDENKIANLQSISVAIQQYHDICLVYPTELIATETCGALGGQDLGDLIPEINSYEFNGVDSDYHYVPLADSSDTNQCIHFHLWADMETNSAYAENSSRYNSKNDQLCGIVDDARVDNGIDSGQKIFDLYR